MVVSVNKRYCEVSTVLLLHFMKLWNCNFCENERSTVICCCCSNVKLALDIFAVILSLFKSFMLSLFVCHSFGCAIVASDIQSTWWRILAQFSTWVFQRTHYCKLLLTLRLVSSWLHVHHAWFLTKSSRCRSLPLLFITSVPSAFFVYATIPNLVSCNMLSLITFR